MLTESLIDQASIVIRLMLIGMIGLVVFLFSIGLIILFVRMVQGKIDMNDNY